MKDNPYDKLISDCGSQVVSVKDSYQEHRRHRNANQKAIILNPTFESLDIDPILFRLVNKQAYPLFQDTRHCLVFWARPTLAIQALIRAVQLKLRDIAPNLWVVPAENLHMTTLEIAHSLTEAEISAQVASLQASLEEITNFTYSHPARLVQPMISFDAAAVALSFVPAHRAGSKSTQDSYTYHHLRRDLHSLCETSGAAVRSRYIVPSAHLTIARFVTNDDFAHDSNSKLLSAQKLELWLQRIEEVNQWLRETYWTDSDDNIPCGGEWIVGSEKGLECCVGTLWYGNGVTVRLGKGS